MTEKQENILKVALELFAKEGVAAVSSKMIAKEAGVSEGLIFRHFENKEGLLKAIMEKGNERASVHFSTIVFETDPKAVIRKFIELPATMDKAEYPYWRLIFALKWQKGSYDAGKMEPLKTALTDAFLKLGYTYPAAEADVLLRYFDGSAAYMLLQENANPLPAINLLKSKYNL
jgi:AcrR family transcriptional regulator